MMMLCNKVKGYRPIFAICCFLRLMWLLSTWPLTSLFSFVLTCLCVCIIFLSSSIFTVAMFTGHYPVPSGAVNMTRTEPCKEAESVSKCIAIGWMHAILIKAPQWSMQKTKQNKKTLSKEKIHEPLIHYCFKNNTLTGLTMIEWDRCMSFSDREEIEYWLIGTIWLLWLWVSSTITVM